MAYSREAVAKGAPVATVARTMKISRQALYRRPTPRLHPQSKVIVDEDYTESWVEGMDVYHNPRAKDPLDPAMLQGAAHHRLRGDEQIETVAPEWQPVGSYTMIIVPERAREQSSSLDPAPGWPA